MKNNRDIIQSEVKPSVGMLRQWLNEDRITDPKKMVTNEDLEYWLKVPKESPVSQSVEGWEKEFDRNFPHDKFCSDRANWRNCICGLSEIKSFLHGTLSTLVKEMEKEQKSMLRDGDDLKVHYFNRGISAAVEVVKKMGV